MAEVAVGGAGDHLAVDRAELARAVTERDDFGRTDEGEVGRVEEEDEVLPLVV